MADTVTGTFSEGSNTGSGICSIEDYNYNISPEGDMLYIKLKGRVDKVIRQSVYRMNILFVSKSEDRHFPVRAICGGRSFMVDVAIELPFVFYGYNPDRKNQDVNVYLKYLDPNTAEWKEKKLDLVLPGKYFVSKDERRRKNIFAYMGASLLLPVWLLQGYMAYKGRGKLHEIARLHQGRAAVIYHAHGVVSDLTGYGYSIREFKTNYFKKCYEKYNNKYLNKTSILFLSERKPEKDGNLMLIKDKIEKIYQGRTEEYLNEKTIDKLSLKEIRKCADMLAKAKVVVLEDFYPQLHALDINPETFIIQLWHACGAFKLFGLSELGVVSRLKQNTKNHRSYDIAITSSESIVPFYSEAFGLNREKVKALGVPRTDIFFDKEAGKRIKNSLHEKYPVLKDKKICLFAPTFRGEGNKTAYYPMEKETVNRIITSLPDDYILVIKHHPFVRETVRPDDLYSDRFLDLSEKESVNDLLFATDVLITDYSSVIFEASLLDIDMIFYVFDLDKYIESRDFYFDFESFVPGTIVRNEEELYKTLENVDNISKNNKEAKNKFREFFLEALDGKSTERVADEIKELMGGYDV